jgi:hypothetical protein
MSQSSFMSPRFQRGQTATAGKLSWYDDLTCIMQLSMARIPPFGASGRIMGGKR